MHLSMPEQQILKIISATKGISRKQLTAETGLSQASVTKITKGLIEQRYIVEGERISKGLGRREVLLCSNPEKFMFLAVDIGGYRVRIAAADGDLRISHQCDVLMAEAEEWSDKTDFLVYQIETFLVDNGLQSSDFDSIGIGVTGIVDPTLKTILSIPNAEGWESIELVAKMSDRFQCPVFLDEGGRTMAMVEEMLGKARGIEDFIVVHVGFGLVAGIMTNGRLVRGSSNIGGLLGHVTADEQAGRCLCGNYGCIENIITFPMLEREYHTRGGNSPTLLEAYVVNDKKALDVCIDAGHALGVTLSNVVNLFNPQVIYIGGSVFQSLPLLLEETKRTLILRANRFATISLTLDDTTYGNDEGLLGALALAKSRLLYG